MHSPPTVLMLQGPLGPLYGQVAGHMMAAGARVHRVQFSGNDVADWPHPKALDFYGLLDEWPAFLEHEVSRLGIDRILLHGDRRPYHKAAIAWARTHGIDVHVSELGYTRPDWMVLEREGISALSRFPVEAEKIRSIAARSAPVDFTPRWRGRTWPLVLGEIRFTLFNALGRRRFPHYQSHRSVPASRVYPGWLAARLRSALRGQMKPLPNRPRFVFALQLDGDLQLRDHSPFSDVVESVDHIAASFAAHAPADAVLVLKPHPHDFGRRRLAIAVEMARSRLGLIDRMVVVDDRTIGELSEDAQGFVTVNSSAGIEALTSGCPVHCVLPTIYDVPGLTHQGALNAFWTSATKPDVPLLADFLKAIAATLQVRGTIYHPDGCRAAAKDIAERVLADRAEHTEFFEHAPPRLAKAASMGVFYGPE